jgi:hypothetical protein
MQNGAQALTLAEGRLLGFVRVLVGGQLFSLPVQALSFENDSTRSAGGFFTHGSQLGIVVEDGASESEIRAQIERGTAEAVRHLSQKHLS